MHPTASAFVTVGIGTLALGVLALVLLAVRRTAPVHAPTATAVLLGWVLLTGALAGTGVLRAAQGRPLFAIVVGTLALGVWLGRSAAAGAVAAQTPVWTLVAVQGFRFPLELVMHAAAREGTMPTLMSYGGANFDVVSGAAALVCGVLLWRGAPRLLAWLFLGLGTCTLAVIFAIAVVTAPALRWAGEDQVNMWVTYVPFVWLPAVLVLAAIAGQITLYRALRAAPAPAI